MEKRLVVFDLDGTLLNTIADLAVSVNYALRECGFEPHPLEAYPMMVGNGVRNLIGRSLPQHACTEANKDRVLSSFLRYYALNMAVHTHVYEGVSELIGELAGRGIVLGVASNKYQAGTEQLVKRYFAEGTFAVVLGQREGVPRKPDPAVLIEAMERVGVAPSATLFVGDSGVDMETACAAGVQGVGVTWGFRDEEELIESGAWRIIRRADELLPLLGVRTL